MFAFGWRTAILSLVTAQVLALAIALLRAPRNRPANRSLALLLTLLVGMITPYTIGFAGVYDAFPWLTFAPFACPLAIGPLVLAYACAWTDSPMRPARRDRASHRRRPCGGPRPATRRRRSHRRGLPPLTSCRS